MSILCFEDDAQCCNVQAQDGAKGVAVNSPIAILAEEGDDLSGAAKLAEEATSESSQPPKKEEPKEEKKESVPEPPKSSESSKPAPKSSESKTDLPAGDRIFASPIAKKIALERGIPLAKIKGSGPEGRIIREDVEKYQPSTGGAASSAAANAASAAFGAPPSAQTPDYVDVPLTNMRRTIGTRLTQAKVDAPHYYLTVDINMDKVTKLREVFNKSLAEKDKGAKLSVNDFIVKGVSKALEDVPEANTAWLGEAIRQ